jgi:hypothetical protein
MDPKWIQIDETRRDNEYGTHFTIAGALEHSKHEDFKRLMELRPGSKYVGQGSPKNAIK